MGWGEGRVQGWFTKTIAWSCRVTRGPWVCTTDQRKIGLCSMNKLSLITFRRASLVAMWFGICLQCRRLRFDPWIGKIPWSRAWQSTPVLLAWTMPWTEEPGRLQSMRSQRVKHSWTTDTLIFIAFRSTEQSGLRELHCGPPSGYSVKLGYGLPSVHCSNSQEQWANTSTQATEPSAQNLVCTSGGSSHSWAQFCDYQGSQVSDNESVSIQPSADSCVLTQWWWGQVACLPTLFMSGTPEWSEILCTFLRTLVLGKIFWCLAFRAYLYLCLFSILYFYNFLLDAVLCSCRLNVDLTVFRYIYI